MTQSVSVYRDISVIQKVRYFAALAGAGASRAEEVVQEVGLAGQRSQRAGTLSGGQLSRVSLGCALVGDPAVPGTTLRRCWSAPAPRISTPHSSNSSAARDGSGDVSLRLTLATTARILRQLAHDKRTLAIVTVVPIVVITLLHYLFSEQQPFVSRVELIMLAVFPITVSG